LAVLLPSAIDSTVMSALPAATAVTNPSLSTVAIASSLLVKLTALYDALLGAIVAFNVAVAPTSNDKVDLSNVTPVTGICLAVTVNAHLAVLLPSLVVTVMSALPALTAVTLPLLSTVAIAASDDANVTVLSVAVDGATVATKLPVAPSSNDKVVLSNVTPVTLTTAFLTVTVAVSDLLPSCVVTVIVASPSATPVTVPLLDTVATASSELLYDTALFVAVDGATVLFNLVVAYTLTLTVLGSIVTHFTDIGFVLNDGTSTFSDSPFSLENDTW